MGFGIRDVGFAIRDARSGCFIAHQASRIAYLGSVPPLPDKSVDLLDVSLKRIAHHQKIVALTGDRIPIDHIRPLVFAESGYRLGAAASPGIGRGCAGGVSLADKVVP